MAGLKLSSHLTFFDRQSHFPKIAFKTFTRSVYKIIFYIVQSLKIKKL